jgi:SAM-dependent methyltransferase
MARLPSVRQAVRRAVRRLPLGAAEYRLYRLALADRRDRLKRPILAAEGAIKLLYGDRQQAASYWRYVARPHAPRRGAPVEYGPGYYAAVEDAAHADYIESNARLVAFAAPDRGEPILDFGCGRGWLVRRLQALGYGAVTGCDVSEYAVRHAVAPGVVPFRGFADFAAGQFGVTCLISVLEHATYAELPGLLAEIARLTRRAIVCCIPLYPDNLVDFFRDPDHRVLERRAWWDARLTRLGFRPAALPAEPLPYIQPFVYERR